MAPVRFQEAERALCRDGGVRLCQAGWGFVFVLKLGENSALLSLYAGTALLRNRVSFVAISFQWPLGTADLFWVELMVRRNRSDQDANRSP
jgi:hypothetical protein